MRARKSVGVFTMDRGLVVQTWDAWIAEATGVPESVACGEPLVRLYPELAERGLLARLRRVAEDASVDVLAPALHKYLLPCRTRDRQSQFEHMRQHVTIAPLRDFGGAVGVVVTIEDVTPRFDRDRRLAAELDNEDESVRFHAAMTLSADGDAPSLLSTALGDSSWRVRRAAVEGMAAGGGREVVDTLIAALRDHHRNPALLNAAIAALARSSADVTSSVSQLLHDADADVRMYAALALGLMDDARAVPELLGRLDDANTNVRFHAIEALGRIGDRRAAGRVADIAERCDFYLSFAALDALAGIGDASVAPRLLPLLDDPVHLLAAASCLGAIGAEDVVPALASLTSHAAAAAAVATIALALANIHDRLETTVGEGGLVADLARSIMPRASADALVAAIPAANHDELRGIAAVLSWLDHDGVDDALASLFERDELRAEMTDLLVARGVRAAPVAARLLLSGSSDDLRAAAYVLGQLGSVADVPALIDALAREADGPSIIAVVGALGTIGDARAFTPLLALLDHDESTVRQAAVAALSSIGDPRMEFAVATRLTDPSSHVRESAIRIAGYFGYVACLKQMVELCDDPDPVVRRVAVESLANYEHRAAWSKIHETLASDTDATVRAAAVRALGQSRRGDSLHFIATALRDANLWVRYYGARAAARCGVLQSDLLVALVECAARDGAAPVRIAAIEAMAALRATSMTNVLAALTRDPDDGVASAAIVALGHFAAGPTAGPLLSVLADEEPTRQKAALEAFGLQRAAAAHAVDDINVVARVTRDPEVRRRAIQTLAEIGQPVALQALVSLAEHHRCYELAAAALADAGAERLVALERELETGGDAAREIVADALGRMKRPDAAGVLAPLLDDASPQVRFAAARGLGRLDARSVRAPV